MTSAYNEGRIAFEDDKEIIDNPYPELSGDWNDWRKGWIDASEDDWGGGASPRRRSNPND